MVLVLPDPLKRVVLEMTGDHLEETFERKLTKYDGLVIECWQGSLRAKCFPVDVGCGGFAAPFLFIAFSLLGIRGKGGDEPSTASLTGQRGHQSGCGFKEENHGGRVASLLTGRKLGPDHHKLGHLDEGV